LLGILPQKLPILALTATANRRVERDILQQMGVGVQVKRGTMQRPNLYLDTVILRGDEEKLYYLSRALQQWPGCVLHFAL
jgi:ATP-dependent DNA helicase RecQ